jgi:hypothetical protein
MVIGIVFHFWVETYHFSKHFWPLHTKQIELSVAFLYLFSTRKYGTDIEKIKAK